MIFNCTSWSAPLKRPRSDSTLRLSNGCGRPKVGNATFSFTIERHTKISVLETHLEAQTDWVPKTDWLLFAAVASSVAAATRPSRPTALQTFPAGRLRAFHIMFFFNIAKYKCKIQIQIQGFYKTNFKNSRYSAVPSNRTAALPSCSQTLWLSVHVFLNAKYKYKYKAAYKTKNKRYSAVPSTRTFPASSLSFSFWFSWGRHQKKSFVFFWALPKPQSPKPSKHTCIKINANTCGAVLIHPDFEVHCRLPSAPRLIAKYKSDAKKEANCW